MKIIVMMMMMVMIIIVILFDTFIWCKFNTLKLTAQHVHS